MLNQLHVLDPFRGDTVLNLPVSVQAGAPAFQLIGIGTLIATADPGVNTDSSAGVSIGMVWFNNAAGAKRWWECYDATVGAAKWVFSGADYANGGTNPSVEVTQFGLGASLMAAEGNINRQLSVAGIQPGTTANDNVLMAFTLPANSFDILGRGITLTAQGSFGATGNNKRVKLIANATTAVVGSAVTGGTTIADTGTVATNGGGWSVQANVFKTGAAGSNTQLGLHQQAQIGAAVAAMLAPTAIAAVESGPILFALCGNATTAATDILANFLEVNAMN